MSMFEITGQLINCLDDRQLNKETGEMLDTPRVQILGEMPLQHSDQTRAELVTLKVEDLGPYRTMKGKTIRIPFGMFSPAKGQVIQFVPKGSKPQLAQGSAA
jgi:hypothetical protein